MMWHGWKPLRADLAQITSPILFFKSIEDHVVDETSLAIIKSKSVSSREFTEVSLPESYHVATLDNDAETIFDESADVHRPVTCA